MSDYFTQEAFDARLAARRANPAPPSPLRVFYHIACMGNWREVVMEQLRLLAHVGLKEATSCVLGTAEDAGWIAEKAEALGILLLIPNVVNALSLYELPTLELLYEWASANPEAAVLYFHTKGVSNPADPRKKPWRRLMQKHVIGNWRENLDKLAVADILGVSWQELRDFPHFCGNFWMARCDWISKLQRPSEYRYSRPPFRWAGHSWNKRMFVETWIGSKNYHHVESLVCRNASFWEGHQVFGYDTSIDGFDYMDGLKIELGGGSKPKRAGYVNVDRQSIPGVDHVCDFELLHPAGMARLPFEDESVGEVYSAHCFEHVRNLHGLLHEIARVCRIGARVEIVVPAWNMSMSMCHDHKQMIPPEQVRHWTETAIDYWWKGSPRRFQLIRTEYVPGPAFAEAKGMFPHLSDEQAMRFLCDTCSEHRYVLQVVPNP